MSAVPAPMAGRGGMAELELSLQPKQEDLYDLMESRTARWILFAGAQGAAKSAGIRRVNLMRRATYPGTGSILFRRTLPELKLNHLQPMFSDWPGLEKFYNQGDRMLRLPNGSWTYFGSADNKAHLDRIGFGPEFADIFVDEGQQVDWEWQDLLHSRNRVTRSPIWPCHVIAGNPGGRGHADLKRRFIDRNFLANERGDEYAFIPAHAWDNVEWARGALADDGLGPADYYSWTDAQRKTYFLERTERGRAMDAYPPRLREAFLEGSWDTFVGQAFDCWDKDAHPVDLADVGLEPWHPRWISLDWGFNHPCVVLFHASLGGRKRVTYREMVFRQRAPEDVAQAIVAVVKDSGEKVRDILTGGDLFNRHMDEQTVGSRMNRILLEAGLPEARVGNTDRSAGFQIVYDLLATRELLITRNCGTLIDTLGNMKLDEETLDDVEKVNGDDAYDCLKVGMLRDDDPISAPVGVRVRARLEAEKEAGRLPDPISSPTDHYLVTKKAIEDEQKRTGFTVPAWARGLRGRRKR